MSRSGRSDDTIGAGAVQDLKQLFEHPPDLRALLRVVDGAEGTSRHAAHLAQSGVGRGDPPSDNAVAGGCCSSARRGPLF